MQPAAEAAADKMILKRAGAIAEIMINNPARHNAVSLDMWQRLIAFLRELESDPGVRVLIVTGVGDKAFAAGADISRFESERAGLEATRKYNAVAGEATERLYNFPRPTIARIHGYCIGGGLNIAACCDIRIATVKATFAIPAARLGLGYGYAGVKRLAEIVGLPVAMELFYTARRLTAEEASRLGLLNRVVEINELDDAVAEMARTICENAPLTIATIKAIARELGRPSAARDMARIEQMVEACFASNDYAEGRLAFMEKRKPNFTGT
ncbi:MAG: enoyl-CoA hydratase [Hyphomicrobiaceae bacterium]|nr:MAG: enoyl-CoA hydratase [Hyphomicrobiaceae bacterium]KAB2851798.1 MAG: enoyl-CoA hydratase [Hyphomicrobiaceae bacterium]